MVSIPLPPLRDRREDIPQLFAAFCLQAAERYRRPQPDLSVELFDWLMAQDWPGNVRELQHAADRFVLGLWQVNVDTLGGGPNSLAQRVAGFELSLIEGALLRSGGDVAAAAEALGLPRKTLYDKLAKYRVEVERYRSGELRPSAAPAAEGRHPRSD